VRVRFGALAGEDLERAVAREEVEEPFDPVLVGGVQHEQEAVLPGRDHFGEDRYAVAAGVGCRDVLEQFAFDAGRQGAGRWCVSVVGEE
jgi:hypothetical protein